jgi:rRNA maturation endonuclease Nob1
VSSTLSLSIPYVGGSVSPYAEVSLHRKNKTLLEQQREINQNLRKKIATTLRAHEDDISQFSEILQIAPAIFASFITSLQKARCSMNPDTKRPNYQRKGRKLRKKRNHKLKCLRCNQPFLSLNLKTNRICSKCKSDMAWAMGINY